MFDGKIHKRARVKFYNLFENIIGREMTINEHTTMKDMLKGYASEAFASYRKELRLAQAALELSHNDSKKKNRDKKYNSSHKTKKPDFKIKQKTRDAAEPNEKEQEEIANEAVQETRKMTKEEIAAKMPDKTYL